MTTDQPGISAPRSLRIESRHLSDAVADRVRDWFLGRIRKRELDGDRSVRIAHPEKDGFQLKIKGAGFRGGAIQFGALHRSGLKAPHFDFEGRMVEDIASGHDNAYRGAASFQQATTEYRVTQMLTQLGIPVVPCLGYGRVAVAGRSAWFSVFEWDRTWMDTVRVPTITVEEYAEAHLQIGETILGLALEHDLIGYCWYVARSDNTYVIKDVHPFRFADPVNMSQLTWTMHVIFALHIPCLSAAFFTRSAEDVPEDIQAFPFRAIVPDATRADHDQLRFSVVANYMLRPPEEFNPEDLLAALSRNRLSRTLLGLCPERFVRF